MRYRTLLIDPPWPETMIGRLSDPRHSRPDNLTYPTLTVEQLKTLPVERIAADNSHLWLWTTNRSLPDGFDLMRAWGFKFMCPVHWVKPSGFGAWWVHRTQTLLFGYKGKCEFKTRLHPNVLFASAKRHGHSTKPEESYELIEAVSFPERLEIFGRKLREGWDVWGNDIDGTDIRDKLCSTNPTA